ncbi:hypothetical protein F4167_15965 [Candidatus Poribacteria bacterium]|nr:hypothetical protein [Candidatus Poribacteria bacterium]MYG08076.1 hypothetical protein [Candidatus Poribacteria bacterium]
MPQKTSNHKQKRLLWSCIIGTLGLLTIGTFLVWFKNQPPLKPIIIYRTVPIEEMNTDKSTPQRAKKETQNLPNAEKQTSQEHTHDGHTHTHGGVATSEPQDRTISDALIRPNHTASETEALSREELDALAHQSWHKKWEKEMAALTAELDAKYPDLVELGSVPLEEWLSRYPTEEAFEALGERIDAMQSEFKARFRTLVAEMPLDHQIEYITLLGDVAAQNWGDEVANQIVGELIANLE